MVSIEIKEQIYRKPLLQVVHSVVHMKSDRNGSIKIEKRPRRRSSNSGSFLTSQLEWCEVSDCQFQKLTEIIRHIFSSGQKCCTKLG